MRAPCVWIASCQQKSRTCFAFAVVERRGCPVQIAKILAWEYYSDKRQGPSTREPLEAPHYYYYFSTENFVVSGIRWPATTTGLVWRRKGLYTVSVSGSLLVSAERRRLSYEGYCVMGKDLNLATFSLYFVLWISSETIGQVFPTTSVDLL